MKFLPVINRKKKNQPMETPLTRNISPGKEPPDLVQYEKTGGYAALRKALTMSPTEVQAMVKESNLRGRGGAGFPTAQKWSFVPMGEDAPRPKYLVCNADEMEPGTFKDRLLLEGDPHQLIEGMIISAYAIQADVAYVFLRWAYKLAARRMERAITEAYHQGYLGKNILGSAYSLEMHLHVSAGRYMCGEETALLNALEGKRANPRAKPPYPQVSGLWGKPTIVNNVETLCNIPHIVNRGAAWFKSLSRSGDGGTKLYGASGRVKNPGLWELPMGTPLREILEEHAGGMRDGYQFRGLLPGGASTDFVLTEHLDAVMDFDSMQAVGSRLGTGTMIVLDDKTCPVGMLLNLEHFFAQESCGWCTPCWSGLSWIEQILQDMEEGRGQASDLERLESHTRLLGPGHTFCALAPGAAEPLQSGLKYFRHDFERHIHEKRCPWGERDVGTQHGNVARRM
jgi:NADH-quinone oxidoreductase subunit F